jgi:hypothetical protein
MRFPLCTAFLLVLSVACDCLFAQGILPGDRWPVQGTPLICGREIPQFVLFVPKPDPGADKKRPNLRVRASNLFIPVSQDKTGVFYHAMNGIVEYDYNYGRLLVPGGLYVSKTQPNTIFVYFGDARKPGWDLRPLVDPLPMKVLEKLRIGHFVESSQKKTPKN